ncbi:hypothetical protein P879_10519 [Paragonimus westermani]|uniref:Leishmanolysin-like peptidase n=1 Tax=Paragonimus westermani TaxID=34504 RepID=A0A8T0DD81_9TREM|nr:hypothetical protein P879_10519 [Paragonimus westermani]
MSQAEPLTWGRNLGCDFVLKSCYEYMEIQKRRNLTVSPWCNEVTLSSRCLSDENAFGFCNLKNIGRSLGPQNQYFSELDNLPDYRLSTYGGRDVLADYCPTQVTGLPTNSFNITAPILFVLITIPKELGRPHDVLM